MFKMKHNCTILYLFTLYIAPQLLSRVSSYRIPRHQSPEGGPLALTREHSIPSSLPAAGNEEASNAQPLVKSPSNAVIENGSAYWTPSHLQTLGNTATDSAGASYTPSTIIQSSNNIVEIKGTANRISNWAKPSMTATGTVQASDKTTDVKNPSNTATKPEGEIHQKPDFGKSSNPGHKGVQASDSYPDVEMPNKAAVESAAIAYLAPDATDSDEDGDGDDEEPRSTAVEAETESYKSSDVRKPSRTEKDNGGATKISSSPGTITSLPLFKSEDEPEGCYPPKYFNKRPNYINTVPSNKNFEKNSDGCKVWKQCTITAGGVQVLYFPTGVQNQSHETELYDIAMQYTFQSPTIYLAFKTIWGWATDANDPDSPRPTQVTEMPDFSLDQPLLEPGVPQNPIISAPTSLPVGYDRFSELHQSLHPTEAFTMQSGSLPIETSSSSPSTTYPLESPTEIPSGVLSSTLQPTVSETSTSTRSSSIDPLLTAPNSLLDPMPTEPISFDPSRSPNPNTESTMTPAPPTTVAPPITETSLPTEESPSSETPIPTETTPSAEATPPSVTPPISFEEPNVATEAPQPLITDSQAPPARRDTQPFYSHLWWVNPSDASGAQLGPTMANKFFAFHLTDVSTLQPYANERETGPMTTRQLTLSDLYSDCPPVADTSSLSSQTHPLQGDRGYRCFPRFAIPSQIKEWGKPWWNNCEVAGESLGLVDPPLALQTNTQGIIPMAPVYPVAKTSPGIATHPSKTEPVAGPVATRQPNLPGSKTPSGPSRNKPPSGNGRKPGDTPRPMNTFVPGILPSPSKGQVSQTQPEMAKDHPLSGNSASTIENENPRKPPLKPEGAWRPPPQEGFPSTQSLETSIEQIDSPQPPNIPAIGYPGPSDSLVNNYFVTEVIASILHKTDSVHKSNNNAVASEVDVATPLSENAAIYIGATVTRGGAVATALGSNKILSYGSAGIEVQFPAGSISTVPVATTRPKTLGHMATSSGEASHFSRSALSGVPGTETKFHETIASPSPKSLPSSTTSLIDKPTLTSGGGATSLLPNIISPSSPLALTSSSQASPSHPNENVSNRIAGHFSLMAMLVLAILWLCL
ncbi:hypothetical protein BJ875DRAFT_174735 [Amylocarpus encephaloides]|uniref:Uncharacterized protein n=1 Tax=Amylocarpus encephaloides TaxID=45428 RepID=A0A9P8C7V9_9HELO|nr:hypothetical protein BJ875DRAFT_174735 [Amylocarpus encephaloides]